MTIDKDIEERFASLEARVRKLESLISTEVEPTSIRKAKKISVREFLKTKSFSSAPDVALAIGYYLEKNEGMASFHVGDLETAFRAAKEKPPKNTNDAVYKCVKRGLMMDAPEKKGSNKAWCLTSSGEEYIENDQKKTSNS